MHSNGHLEHQKMHFVSIQIVPKMHLSEPKNAFREHSNCTQMHLFLSRIGKQMHSNDHLEASKCMS